jgi:hypothetical protein
MSEISYENIPEKAIDEPVDANQKAMKDAAIKKLEKTQIDKQTRAEAGIIDIPKEPEQIPKELPKYIFSVGAKAIHCSKFNIDDDEAKLLAKHISILTGNINSKIFSLIIIIIVVVAKVTECMDAISRKFAKNKEQKAKTPEQIYEEQKKSEVSG